MTLEDELTTAAAKGDTAHVESLLRAGAQVNGVNCFGRTALQVSVTRCASPLSNFSAFHRRGSQMTMSIVDREVTILTLKKAAHLKVTRSLYDFFFY